LALVVPQQFQGKTSSGKLYNASMNPDSTSVVVCAADDACVDIADTLELRHKSAHSHQRHRHHQQLLTFFAMNARTTLRDEMLLVDNYLYVTSQYWFWAIFMKTMIDSATSVSFHQKLPKHNY
jgi:hypothetical protein